VGFENLIKRLIHDISKKNKIIFIKTVTNQKKQSHYIKLATIT